MDITNLVVGQKIKSLRLELGESMEKFGERFNTSKGTVNNWEKGRNLPNNQNLVKIAKLANSTVGDFLFSIPDKNRKIVFDKYIDENIKDPEEKEFIKNNFFHSSDIKNDPLMKDFTELENSSSYWEIHLESVKDDFKIKKMLETSSPIQIMEYISSKIHTDFFEALSILTGLLGSYNFIQSLKTENEKKTFRGLILKFQFKKQTIDN